MPPLHRDITLTVNSGRATARSSDRSAESLIDEEDSSGVDVHLSPSSDAGSPESSDHEYGTDSAEDFDDSWTQLSKADVGPSESASRPSTSNQHRVSEVPRRRHSRREAAHVRLPHRSTAVHRPHPSSPPSVGSNEDLLAYGPDLPLRPRRQYYQWTPTAGGQGQNYAPSYSSQGYPSYPSSSAAPPGQQLVPFANAVSQYQYSPYQQPGGHAAGPGYFGHPNSGMGGAMGPTVPPPGAHPYPSLEMMHHANAQHYYPYHPPQGYPVPHPIAPSPVYQHYSAVYTPPPQPLAKSPSPAAQADPPPKDDAGLAELKQMILDEKAEREAREAAAKKAEEERIAAAEAAKVKADEIAAAAAAATTEAEKKAAATAAEEAEKRKAEAEEAAAKAKQELDEAAAKAKEDMDAAVAAAAAAATPAAPEEKRKPIKFKDAVGRKFSFPFHLCATWVVSPVPQFQSLGKFLPP